MFPGGWWVKSDFSVSLCPFSYTFGHTDTEMDTELDKKSINKEKFLKGGRGQFENLIF